MKYSEFHRFVKRSKSGWKYIGAEGSHYIINAMAKGILFPSTVPRKKEKD